MAINLKADGQYREGQTVRLPARRSTGTIVWGDVVEQNGAAVLVEVRQTVGRGRLRTWTETYSTTELDETARRFAASHRRSA